MAALSLRNFTTLVQSMAAAVQGSASTLVDMTVGSVSRAIVEASASAALWLQWLIILVLQRTRLATSTGTDVDTWVGDFSLLRLPAVAATGTVTLSRFVASSSATVPVGVTVRTGDAAQTYSIVAGGASYWNASVTDSNGNVSGGYIIPASVLSVDVPIKALVAGSAGNVQAGAINLLGSAISGIDTCTNAVALTTGIDAESDAALRARFPNYIAGLSKGTPIAVGAAIQAVQQELTYAIAENVSEDGTYRPGHFVVTLDDGTGNPSSSLIEAVYSAVDAVRALCSTFSVQPPTIVNVTISLTISAAAGFSKPDLIGPVGSAITAYVNSLPIGSGLSYTRVAQVAYQNGVGNVTALLLNGAQTDISVGPSGTVKIASVAVN